MAKARQISLVFFDVLLLETIKLFMSALLEVTKIHKSFDEHIILRDISFSVLKKSKIGLVGENGSGKSTLLKIITGEETYNEGRVVKAKGVTIAYVPQVPEISADILVKSFLENYTDRPYKVEEALGVLGVQDILNKTFGSLSGGQKTKVYLARIALFDADVLLLDEPTNHLDIQGLDWLEEYLRGFEGAFVLVSHDRYFLDRVVGETIELEHAQLQAFGGNYSFYKEQKKILQDSYKKQYDSQKKEIQRLEKVSLDKKNEGNARNMDRKNHRDNDKMGVSLKADRGSKKSHATAKSIDSRIEHITALEKPKKESVLDVYFKPSGSRNSNVVGIENFDVAYSKDNPLFHISNFDILYGQRIALQGENGSGKTTLIKRILNNDQYEEISLGSGVKIGYLSQDHSELHTDSTAFDLLTSIEGIDKTAAYKILSQLTIHPDQMKQKLSDFSSGQKTKLLLAKIMASGANFIILDEPTNHLDFDSIDVIEKALLDFKGTILCISHDRYFLEQIGINRYVLVEGGELRVKKMEDAHVLN